MTTRIIAAASVALVALAALACESGGAQNPYDATEERSGEAMRDIGTPSLEDGLAELEAERAEREARWDRDYPRREPVYVDCNAFGVVNGTPTAPTEQRIAARNAASAGHQRTISGSNSASCRPCASPRAGV